MRWKKGIVEVIFSEILKIKKKGGNGRSKSPNKKILVKIIILGKKIVYGSFKVKQN